MGDWTGNAEDTYAPNGVTPLINSSGKINNTYLEDMDAPSLDEVCKSGTGANRTTTTLQCADGSELRDAATINQISSGRTVNFKPGSGSKIGLEVVCSVGDVENTEISQSLEVCFWKPSPSIAEYTLKYTLIQSWQSKPYGWTTKMYFELVNPTKITIVDSNNTPFKMAGATNGGTFNAGVYMAEILQYSTMKIINVFKYN